MAAKKQTRKKQTRSKRTAGKKVMATKKRVILKKKSAKKKPAQKKAPVKTKAVGKKTMGVKTVSALKKRVREKSQSVDTVAFSPEGPVARSGRQSGDLQGLSSVESADSESVGELLEEGNAFEIRSAHCTADEIRYSVRGLGRLSPRSAGVFKCRATRIPATMASTRFRPSSILRCSPV